MDQHEVYRRLQGLSRLIGNTPLLAIDFTFRGKNRVIYAKLENLNMTGSIKDRMALHILRRAYDKGAIRSGDIIAEATSGNTGIAFSGLGRALGHPVKIFMPDWMSRERIDLIHSLGADITLVSKEQGGFLGSIRQAEELAVSKKGVFLPRQFSNQDNAEAHYRSTGPEIWHQMLAHSLEPDAFVAGVGTGGTVMGVGRYLRERKPAIKVHPLEPSSSPTLSTGYQVGHHRIQGISDEFIPPIVDLKSLDAVIKVEDGDSILMAQKLAYELGIGIGISSGANFLGALLLQEEMGIDAAVVTVFSDDNKKYLSTDLMREEPVRDGYLAPGVSLKGFRAFRRECDFCPDRGDVSQVVPLDQETLAESEIASSQGC
jgi:cysteine synthase